MSALYITALLFLNTALLIHLLWDSAFVQSINHSINQSLGFAYFSPSIEAFVPSVSTTNALPINVDRIELSAESLIGNAPSTWRTDSPLDSAVKVHPNDAELLAESITLSTRQSINQTSNYIPNIAHFIIGATHTARSTKQSTSGTATTSSFASHSGEPISQSAPTFSLINYLAIKSAADIGGFESIVCHVLNQPISSVYWQLAIPYCTHIELINESDDALNQPINSVFGRSVYHKSIKAEIARLRVLLQYGGHGIEDDVIFINPMPGADVSISPADSPVSWADHELVLGYSKSAHDNWPERPDVSIVSAKASSWMLAEWFETYRMYEDASTSQPTNGEQSVVYQPDVERWTHDLAYLLMLSRRHLVALAPVEWWGKLYAREAEGQSELYDSNTQLDSLPANTVAVHLWQSEKISVREQRQADGSVLVTDVEGHAKHQVNSFADVCELAKTSLYGQVLKRAMLAGDRHTHTCD